MAGILRVFIRLNAAAVLLMVPMAWGQASSVNGTQTATDLLHQMSDRADVIFMGQVLTVHLPEGGSPASGIVEIQFRVDEAIRGCKTGQPYVLHEWGGLWAGSGRYRVGQRLLMLLHAPSAGGLSSPVGGPDGAIPIRQSGIEASLAESTTQPPSVPFVDLRWLGARLPRAVSYRDAAVRPANAFPPLSPGQQRVETVVASGARAGDGPMILPLGYTSAADASTPAQQASVEVVLGLLTMWQKAAHGTP
jgi:hypothetical protein